MLCFVAMTMEKAEIFININLKCIKLLGRADFRIYQIIKIVVSAYLCKNAGCVAGTSMHALIVCYTIHSYVQCPV